MTQSTQTARYATAAGLALAMGAALTLVSAPVAAQSPDKEKCFGVALKTSSTGFGQLSEFKDMKS